MSRKYTEKEWIEFLKRIGEGRSARDVCGNDKDMPTWRLVSDKLNSDNGFASRYAMAMENRGQVYADKITDTVNDMLNGTIDYNQARVAIDIQRLQKIFITLLITFDLFIRFLQGYFICPPLDQMQGVGMYVYTPLKTMRLI